MAKAEALQAESSAHVCLRRDGESLVVIAPYSVVPGSVGVGMRHRLCGSPEQQSRTWSVQFTVCPVKHPVEAVWFRPKEQENGGSTAPVLIENRCYD